MFLAQKCFCPASNQNALSCYQEDKVLKVPFCVSNLVEHTSCLQAETCVEHVSISSILSKQGGSVMGFPMSNYKFDMLQRIADLTAFT